MFREGWELLIDADLSKRGERFMQAMADAAPPDSVVRSTYDGGRRGLMLYGPGAPSKLHLVKSHIARGGHVASWDLGYWNRETAMRLAIDAMHPKPEHLALAPEGKGRRSFDLREDANPDGPVLLIGLGAKSVYAYDLQPMQWERMHLKDLRKRFPGRQINWRPKGSKAHPFSNTNMQHGMPISKALVGCSLVVCRHSNVAVDACVAGIPVECEDGAAFALYKDNPQPTLAQRREFLRQLSWWEWDRSEAAGAWAWVLHVTGQ